MNSCTNSCANQFAREFMKEVFTNFVYEFKYEIRTNSREFARICMDFLHQKLVMLRLAMYCNLAFQHRHPGCHVGQSKLKTCLPSQNENIFTHCHDMWKNEVFIRAFLNYNTMFYAAFISTVQAIRNVTFTNSREFVRIFSKFI